MQSAILALLALGTTLRVVPLLNSTQSPQFKLQTVVIWHIDGVVHLSWL